MSNLSHLLTILIDRARHYKMTPQEKSEQRISLVFSGLSEESKMTKQDVRRILLGED